MSKITPIRKPQDSQWKGIGVGPGQGVKTPKIVKKARGTFRPDRDGDIDTPDPSSEKPLDPDAPPLQLTAKEREMYDLLNSIVIPGLLFEEDSIALCIFAKVLSRINLGHEKAADYGLAMKFFGQFAMTPSARARLGLDRNKKGEDNGFKEFA